MPTSKVRLPISIVSPLFSLRRLVGPSWSPLSILAVAYHPHEKHGLRILNFAIPMLPCTKWRFSSAESLDVLTFALESLQGPKEIESEPVDEASCLKRWINLNAWRTAA